MMNNLKFRAWHKERESYLKVSAIYFGMQAIYVNERSYQGYCYFDEIIIEQYTGLKDKNGKEIYIGDTVRYDRNIGLTIDGYRFVVAYEEGQVFLDHKFSECKNIDWDLVTIVGNIHENKELLD